VKKLSLIRSKPEGVSRWRRKGLTLDKCVKVGLRKYLKTGQKCGINAGLARFNKFRIDSPVRWEHCGYPVPEMEPDTEHRQCPHEGEEPHNYPDDEDWWEAGDEEA
jgi:hypothetical protein